VEPDLAFVSVAFDSSEPHSEMLQSLQDFADVAWQQLPSSLITAVSTSKQHSANGGHTAVTELTAAATNGHSTQAASRLYVTQAVQTDTANDAVTSAVCDTAVSQKQAELIATLEQALAVAQQQLEHANSESVQLRSEVAALQHDAAVRADTAAAVAQATAAAVQEAAASAESSRMSAVSTSLQALHSVCADAATAAAVSTVNLQQAVVTLQRTHSEHAAAHAAQLSSASTDHAHVTALLEQMVAAAVAQRAEDEQHRSAAATAQSEMAAMLKASQSALVASNTQVRFTFGLKLVHTVGLYFDASITFAHTSSTAANVLKIVMAKCSQTFMCLRH
jgi:hypothetical protein